MRTVAGTYRVTPILVLEIETFILLLDLYLNAKLARFRLRHKLLGIEALVSTACARIRGKLRSKRWRGYSAVASIEGER